MKYIIGAKSRVNKALGYYTGDKKLDVKSKAKIFHDFKVIETLAKYLADTYLQFQFFIETMPDKKPVRKNPIKNKPLKKRATRIKSARKKIKKKNKNPVPSLKSLEARKLYEDFTGESVNSVDKVSVPVIKHAIAIGEMDGIMYTTRRDGEIEHYIHKFKKSARPTLAVSSNGKNVLILGGRFKFTERGFIDQN